MKEPRNNSSSAEDTPGGQDGAPENREITARFAHCGLEDPLLREIHALAQTLAGEQFSADPLQPCGEGMATADLEAALAGLSQPDLAQILNDEHQLPPAPQILTELKAVTADEKSGVEKIAGVILKDAGLSAFLLRLVNSAFYSFPSKIDTVSRAVSILGVKPLYSLALGYVFTEALAAAPKHILNLGVLWKHSLAVGIAAQAIWEAGFGKDDSERLFVSGLLHDLGKLVLAGTAPEQARLLYGQAAGSTPAHELEEACLGFNHARLGGLLLKKWNMPAPLTAAVQWHHNPHQAAQYREPLVVHLADLLVTGLGLGARPTAPVPTPCPLSNPAQIIAEGDLAGVVQVLRGRLEDIHASFSI